MGLNIGEHSSLLLSTINNHTLKPPFMNSYLTESEKRNHPYYRIMELRGEELSEKLQSSTRLELIDWLCWNDRNGVYSDEDSLREFGEILTKERAIEIITAMITEP